MAGGVWFASWLWHGEREVQGGDGDGAAASLSSSATEGSSTRAEMELGGVVGGGAGAARSTCLQPDLAVRGRGEGARRRLCIGLAGRAAWATAVEGARERRWRWEASWRPPRQVGGRCDMAVVVGRRPMRTVGIGVAHHHASATRSGGRRPASRRKGDSGRPTGAARYGGTVGHVAR